MVLVRPGRGGLLEGELTEAAHVETLIRLLLLLLEELEVELRFLRVFRLVEGKQGEVAE